MEKLLETGWQYFRLYPLQHPHARKNDVHLGPTSLGIEVSEPELAGRCGLGNIDPQHGAISQPDCAAIDLALDWPLPPDNSHLVTIRPDADSLGAMAVLSLRRGGAELDDHAVARVRAISRWDRNDHGSWHNWRRFDPSLPRSASARDLGGPPPEIKAVRACAADNSKSMADRVATIAEWLISGTIDARSRANATAFDEALLADWNAGHIRIIATADPRIVVLQSHHSVGLVLGYRQAPVVIAEGQIAGHRKLSIGQFEPGWIDMAKLRTLLANVEAGWGGSATIIGSPQGTSCRIVTADIICMALTCLGDLEIGEG